MHYMDSSKNNLLSSIHTMDGPLQNQADWQGGNESECPHYKQQAWLHYWEPCASVAIFGIWYFWVYKVWLQLEMEVLFYTL